MRALLLMVVALLAQASFAGDTADFSAAWQGKWNYHFGYETPEQGGKETGAINISACKDNHCMLSIENGNMFSTCSFEAPMTLLSATKAQSTALKSIYGDDFKGEPCRVSLTITQRGTMDLDDAGECSYFCGAQSHGFGTNYRRVKAKTKKH